MHDARRCGAGSAAHCVARRRGDREDAAHLALQVGRRARLARRRWCRRRRARPAAARRRAARSSSASSAAWPSALHGDGLDDRAAELGRRAVSTSIARPLRARDVGHVQRDHHRPAEPRQLEHEAQVHAQVGRVDDGDDRVGRRLAVAPAVDHLERDLLVGRRRRQAVGAGQVDAPTRVRPFVQPRQADLALDRDAGVVGDLLARAGEQVEERRLAAVRVADQRDAPARRLVRRR